jgi:hypothetical protein
MLSVKSFLVGSDHMCISFEGGKERLAECLVEDSWVWWSKVLAALEINAL